MKNLLLIIPIVILCIQCNTNGKMNSKSAEEMKRINAKRNLYLNQVMKKQDEQVSSSNDPSIQNKKDPSIQNKKEKYETLTGIKEISSGLTTQKLEWIKNKGLNIKGLDNKPIKELEGKIKYSYSISPIKQNDSFTKRIMPIVVFQSTQNGGEDLTVANFYLKDNPELDFNYRKYPVLGWFSWPLPKREPSKEPGFAYTNTFWVGDQTKETIMALTQDEYIQAKIQVQNMNDQTTNEYEILLDTTYLVRLIQDTINQYPEILKIAPDFKL
ncbi:p23 cell envelope protein (plasmid) [Borrelia miyamotoi]|uniref:P23 cell envelope protein n=1 Tax=Borrelia miyamotoi TaxID=47466 RepID=A0AAX3JNR3_9SPIR|nr:p23 cell envelope protein [Borrelia miyamotoi]QFP42340.1 p23 cell envelope protein [Borrelia miyamotoi]QFP48460.1 p23 cell envelope protein [Borrelia miyamotoi]WAZ72359.1 p23 cell envelope protein [Borrelia miyamotoi]